MLPAARHFSQRATDRLTNKVNKYFPPLLKANQILILEVWSAEKKGEEKKQEEKKNNNKQLGGIDRIDSLSCNVEASTWVVGLNEWELGKILSG